MSWNLPRKLLNDREELVLRRHEAEGYPLSLLAEELGVSRGRVREIYRKAKAKREEYEADPVNGMALLDMRVRRCLANIGYTSRAQLMADIESGELYWAEKERGHWGDGRWKVVPRPGRNLAKMRNFGRKCWLLVQEWLGLKTSEEVEAELRRWKEEAARKREENDEKNRRELEEWRKRTEGWRSQIRGKLGMEGERGD